MDNIVNKLADRVIYSEEKVWAMDIHHFDWVPGIGLYGIYKAYKATGDRKYYDFLIDWTDAHINEAYDRLTVNSTAPLMTVVDLYAECKNPQYLKVMTDIAEYIVKDAPLTRDGGLEHTVTEHKGKNKFGDQMWADTLFMSCLFVAKLGKLLGEQKYIDFAVNQFKLHHKILSDGSGLYFHGYDGANGNHMSGIRWGRANAWIVLSSMELINLLGDFDGRAEIEERVKAHCEALKKVQKPTGGFGTVIDNPDSVMEASATAGIAAGIKKAIKAGIVSESEYGETVRKAEECIKNSAEEDGTLLYVSSGTPVMPDAEAYETIRIEPTLYGQALALALFTA